MGATQKGKRKARESVRDLDGTVIKSRIILGNE
jgi:hypothetical protein